MLRKTNRLRCIAWLEILLGFDSEDVAVVVDGDCKAKACKLFSTLISVVTDGKEFDFRKISFHGFSPLVAGVTNQLIRVIGNVFLPIFYLKKE